MGHTELSGPGDGQRPTHAELIDLARRAAGKAYVPYSGFPVGAALLLADGRVVTGCNVENASFGMTICAERTATTRSVVSRATAEQPRIEVAAVVGLKADGQPCYPCGACRQVLHEFGCRTLVVEADGSPRAHDYAEILPHAFGPQDLED